jgi:hypothetical protein
MNSKQVPLICAGGAAAFTIAIVAVIVPWIFPNLSQQHRAAQLLASRGCKVQVIDPSDLHFQGEVIIQIDGTKLNPNEAHWCGAFSKVTQLQISSSDAPEAFLASLANPAHLRSLDFSRCRITPDLLKLKAFHHIEYLRLSGPEVTDEVLKQLSGFSELSELHLCDTAVTAEGLEELIPLSRINRMSQKRDTELAFGLSYLNLEGTQITSAGVAAIKQMKLSLVTVSAACIKPQDLSVLKKAYPGMVGEPGEPPGVTVLP